MFMSLAADMAQSSEDVGFVGGHSFGMLADGFTIYVHTPEFRMRRFVPEYRTSIWHGHHNDYCHHIDLPSAMAYVETYIKRHMSIDTPKGA